MLSPFLSRMAWEHDGTRVKTGEHLEAASKAGSGMLSEWVNCGKLFNPRASGSHVIAM